MGMVGGVAFAIIVNDEALRKMLLMRGEFYGVFSYKDITVECVAEPLRTAGTSVEQVIKIATNYFKLRRIKLP